MSVSKKIYKDIGATIRGLREENKLTQEELAQSIDVKPATISLYEAGLRKPEISKLRAIASTLGTTLAFLLGSEDEAADVSIALRSEQLTPKEINQVKSYIEFIKKTRKAD